MHSGCKGCGCLRSAAFGGRGVAEARRLAGTAGHSRGASGRTPHLVYLFHTRALVLDRESASFARSVGVMRSLRSAQGTLWQSTRGTLWKLREGHFRQSIGRQRFNGRHLSWRNTGGFRGCRRLLSVGP